MSEADALSVHRVEMLCKACEAHFTFSHPNHTKYLVEDKRDAISSAVREGLSEPLIQKLRDELRRYETAVGSIAQASHPPCPWDIEDETQYNLSGRSDISVWHRPAGRRVLPPRRFRELRESARSSGCRMCRILTAMASYAAPEMDESAVVRSKVILDLRTSRPIQLQFDLSENDCREMLALWTMDLSATSSGNRERVPRSPDTLRLRTPVGTATNDRACIGLFAGTLAECASECVSRGPASGQGWMPNRLLDVDVQVPGWDASRVRLVEKHEMGDIDAMPYLTLSHTWGAASMVKLTKSSLDEFKGAGMEIEKLPRRFSDAVWLVRHLGFRYLWVDSLCIIQDSYDDWGLESSLMGDIYTNSLCTIAAADGPDSGSSMFTERDPLVGGPLTIQQKFQNCIIDFTVLPNWVDLVRSHCNLFTRAWVVQERFLSPRILHLCPFPFYECHCGLMSEACPKRMRGGHFDFPYLPRQQRNGLTSKELGARSAIQRWWEIVEIYTNCSLTYESDKMAAIGSMARVFSETLGQQYYAGIWGGEHLELSLLWRPQGRPISSTSLAEYRAPSWSWASVDGPISTPTWPNIRHSVVEALHAHVIPAEEQDAFGSVTGGILVLRGFLFEIQDIQSRRSSLKPAAMCRLDWGDEALDFDRRMCFLPLADMAHGRSYDREPSFSGLWIQESTPPYAKQGDSAPIFRRVGCEFAMADGGEGYMLDEESWDFLCTHYKTGLKPHGTEIWLV